MRCVVTGAAGFIGSHLCDALLARGDAVIGIDCFTDYYDPALKRANIAPALSAGLELAHLDLCKDLLSDVLDGVEVVFHLAGQPGVRPSWGEDFGLYASRNLLATQRLLEACVRVQPRRFVFASSSSVYGNTNGRPARETDARAPASPYGLTKAACEDLVEVYRREHRFPVVSLRYFTVYGPRQRPEMAFAVFIRSMLQGEPVHVLGDGLQTRDFTYVADAVAATLAAAERGASPAYNVSGGAAATLLEAIAEIERLVRRPAAIEFSEGARGEARHTRADLSAAERDLGYRPRARLAEGLAQQVRAATERGPATLEAVA